MNDWKGKRKFVRLNPVTHKEIRRIAFEKESTIQKEVDILLKKALKQIELEAIKT